MRAITVRQPHAELIRLGLKKWETRGWQDLPTRVVGERLAIHAAGKLAADAEAVAERYGLDLAALPRSAIVCHVLMTETRWLTAADAGEACCECAGRVGIRCENVVSVDPPVPAAGKLSFWSVELPTGAAEASAGGSAGPEALLGRAGGGGAGRRRLATQGELFPRPRIVQGD